MGIHIPFGWSMAEENLLKFPIAVNEYVPGIDCLWPANVARTKAAAFDSMDFFSQKYHFRQAW
jgi:hypothetical protein